ncbi:TVP38/TMEM64 family protein [Alteribacter natronophilus]|uniref:TVP38/TMEM64 family protein n=1 Tax=Alteribacter natronophilus TaxID=2583810 RepID=UPI00110DED43|nr:TVP38/TMEM64 family protein [Alteribacter natronophilus]TMW73333.1 TVP38/TMEM64 family protein [Alteribacter natronophilus]
MIRKISVTLFYLGIAFVIYLVHEPLLTWIGNTDREYAAITALAATLMSLFPVIPYPIVGGVIGAAYGPALGGLIIWIGSSLASVIMFAIVRYGYQDWGKKILHKYKYLEKLTVLFERNAFVTITLLRMIPVIPSIIINVYAALSRVRFLSYAAASSLGKIPSMILFALIGHTIVTDPGELLVMAVVYGTFLAVMYAAYRFWQKRAEQKFSAEHREAPRSP